MGASLEPSTTWSSLEPSSLSSMAPIHKHISTLCSSLYIDFYPIFPLHSPFPAMDVPSSSVYNINYCKMCDALWRVLSYPPSLTLFTKSRGVFARRVLFAGQVHSTGPLLATNDPPNINPTIHPCWAGPTVERMK